MKKPKINDLEIDYKMTEKMRQMSKASKKIKITINVEADTIYGLKKLAQRKGMPYQSLTNALLKEALSHKKNEETRLDKIEKEIAEIKKKISA